MHLLYQLNSPFTNYTDILALLCSLYHISILFQVIFLLKVRTAMLFHLYSYMLCVYT